MIEFCCIREGVTTSMNCMGCWDRLEASKKKAGRPIEWLKELAPRSRVECKKYNVVKL